MQRMRMISALGALALFGSVVALVGLFFVNPLNAWKARGIESRNQVQADIHRIEATIASLRQQSAVISQNEEEDFLWRAEQIGTVTAQIQTSLSASASNNGVSLRSITPLKTKRVASVEAAAFRLEFEATLDQVLGFLQQIEYSSPALLIEKASLRQLSRSDSNQAQPILNAQLELIAPIHLEEAATR